MLTFGGWYYNDSQQSFDQVSSINFILTITILLLSMFNTEILWTKMYHRCLGIMQILCVVNCDVAQGLLHSYQNLGWGLLELNWSRGRLYDMCSRYYPVRELALPTLVASFWGWRFPPELTCSYWNSDTARTSDNFSLGRGHIHSPHWQVPGLRFSL